MFLHDVLPLPLHFLYTHITISDMENSVIISQHPDGKVNEFMEKYSFMDSRIQEYIHEFPGRWQAHGKAM